MAFALTGARVFDGETFHDGMAVVVRGREIEVLVSERDLPAAIEKRQLEGGILAPGFIDVQVNGGGGVLLNEKPTVEGFRHVADAHRRFGTTGILPTVITDSMEVLATARAAGEEAFGKVPAVLGLHQEGPFLDPKRKGAHDARFIRPPTQQDIDDLSLYRGGTLMVTLAPNIVAPDHISQLAANGVRVSLGHSDATYNDAALACDEGAVAFTHVFNAMSQMTAREPGLVGAAFAFPDTWNGIIADGHHVAWPNLDGFFAARGPSQVMVITDAMPSAAGGPDSFELQGRRVTRNNGRLTLADGTLAGSDLTMDVAVRNCVEHLGASVADALRMASRTPAEFLRRKDLGVIAAGALASLVHLNDKLEVLQTWVEGE